MREARPDSFLRTSCSQSASLRRWMIRWTLMPHVYRSLAAKRSWESGMRISTVQPCSSTSTAEAQTASHVTSRNWSL